VTYILLDSNVTAGYYLSRSLKSLNARTRIENIFDSARSGESDFFFYLPNFCVAEVFSVFMKYTFGAWNKHVRSAGTIDTRIYNSLVKQFESDIHNGKFIYHYELSRYHVLGINLVAPVDHYFQISRKRLTKGRKKKKKKKKRIRPNINPMGTFDHLIISMGVHLAHIHGRDNVLVVSADGRLTTILKKCNDGLTAATAKKLKLDQAESLTGKKFAPSSFPRGINLTTATTAELNDAFLTWPLPVGRLPTVYRHTRI
jgi:hypothetical protein